VTRGFMVGWMTFVGAAVVLAAEVARRVNRRYPIKEKLWRKRV
jgi:hypothetical protein